MKKRFRGIATKLNSIIIFSLLISFVILTVVVGYIAGENAEESSLGYAEEMTKYVASELDKLLSNHLKIVISMSNVLTTELTQDKLKIIRMLQKQFESSEWIVATYAGYEPSMFDKDDESFIYNNEELLAFVNDGAELDRSLLGPKAKRLFDSFRYVSPDSIRNDERFILMFSHGENGQFLPFVTGTQDSTMVQHLYNIDIYDFYMGPKRTNAPIVVAPWTFQAARFLTIAAPIQWPDGRFRGVTGLNLDVGEFLTTYNDLKVFNDGYVFIIYKDGMLITYPQEDLTFVTNIRDIGERFGGMDIEKLISDIDIGRPGILEGKDPMYGNNAWFVYHPVKTGNWGVVIVAPEKDIYAAKTHLLTVIVILMSFAVIFIAGIIVLLTRRIVKPVGEMQKALEEVTGGDFTYKISFDSHDEIGRMGQALNTMADSLHAKANLASRIAEGDISSDVELLSEADKLGFALKRMTNNLNAFLSQIQDVSSQVETGSEDVANASLNLSDGAGTQAANLVQITSSIAEISAQTNQNAEHSNRANELSKSVRVSADKGSKDMEMMMQAMQTIKESGDNIIEILKIIVYIADKTNLLAINAGIQAAHAGEHGKGFAVVAKEIRDLSARTAIAANDTSELINESIKNVQNGIKIAGQTQTSFTQIVEGVTHVYDIIGEIAVASNEQAQALAQIKDNLRQIEGVTQNNRITAAQTAAAAEELSKQATNLRMLLNRFKLRG
ncbi:MAG: methyl-accepting chemotaxis protein [Candidatus Latescibacteria bacterium]|nr:methyl-accepting chemotaxis protein [Candidatus Latescibacterota bacterium]